MAHRLPVQTALVFAIVVAYYKQQEASRSGGVYPSMWCHLLLAAPLFGLVLFAVLPMSAALPAYSVVTVGSLLLYRQVWRSMNTRPLTGREAMVGTEAIALTTINADGYGIVRWKGERWSARSSGPVPRGARVQIVDFDELTAIVQRSEISMPEPQWRR